MLEWYLEVNVVFRTMRQKAIDAQGLLASGDKAGAKLVNGYLRTDYQLLRKLWMDAGFPEQDMGSLGRHIGFGDGNDYNDILSRDLPQVETRAETHVRSGTGTLASIGFEALLHPVIFAHAFQHYANGHYRDAVLNSIVAIFDLMRERTGLDLDGAALATQALSLDKPHLILSELETESGPRMATQIPPGMATSKSPT
jgi:hypothetical protein